METANSSVVLPLVELNSAGVSHELVNLIKRKTDGLVREFSPEGNKWLMYVCPGLYVALLYGQ